MRTLIVIVVLGLVAGGCGGRGVSASSTAAEDPPVATTVIASVAPVETTQPTSTSLAESDESTSTAVPIASTRPPGTETTTPARPEPSALLTAETQLPKPFGTVEELMLRTGYFAFEPRDAKIESYMGVDGDLEVLAEHDMEAGPIDPIMTITYYGDMVVWDFGDGYREVSRGGESYVFSDGEWSPNERWEWPPMGPFYEWDHVQGSVEGCVELGAELVGVDEIAGVPSVHIRCTYPDDAAWWGSSNIWVAADGQVMKAYSVAGEEPGFGFTTSWEVIAVDVPPDPPLPPGW